MPARRKKTPEETPEQTPETPGLCGECFPYGLADQPEGATQVSCSHGAWDVAELKDTSPEDPPKNPEDPPEDPKNDGKGDGEGSGN